MSICARFNGGPWSGTYRVLEDARDHWYVPVLEPLSLQALSGSEAGNPAAHVSVRTGTYTRASYLVPPDGLYFYNWSPPR